MACPWKPVNRRFVLALAGVVILIAALGVWHLSARPSPRSARRVYDTARIISAADVPRFEEYLKWIFQESDVDVRLVLLDDLRGDTIEKAAVAWMKRLRIGARGREERGVLILYDMCGQRLRVEVGYGLEEYLPDGFVGYLVNDHARQFFESRDVTTGLRLMLRIVHMRIRRAVLGERFDPRVLKVVRRTGPLSGGAGATAAVALGPKFKRLPAAVASEDPQRYAAQETPEGTYRRYLEWMADGRFEPDIELFTPETRRYLRGFPMSKAYFDDILLGEYGKSFETDVRGGMALLYFTNDPFTSPHFFRRRHGRWAMDLCAEVRNTVERVGGVYTWDYRGRDDDFTKAFSDRLTTIRGYVRIAGGDNRQLPTRRSAR